MQVLAHRFADYIGLTYVPFRRGLGYQIHQILLQEYRELRYRGCSYQGTLGAEAGYIPDQLQAPWVQEGIGSNSQASGCLGR